MWISTQWFVAQVAWGLELRADHKTDVTGFLGVDKPGPAMAVYDADRVLAHKICEEKPSTSS